MFGERLRQLRKEKDMTQKELGAMLNLSDRVIGYYEANRHFPDGDVLVKIAEIFNVSVDYLLDKTDIKINKYSGLSTKEKLEAALDTIHQAVHSHKSINDNSIPDDMTSLLIKKLLKEGIISPNKQIDDETMNLLKKSLEIEAVLSSNKKEDTTK